MYTCDICKKSHPTVPEYVKCVSECSKRIEAEDKQKKMAELNAQREARLLEVNKKQEAYRKAYAEYKKAYEMFTKDYPRPELVYDAVPDWFRIMFG